MNDCTRTASFVSYRPNHLLGISEGAYEIYVPAPPIRICQTEGCGTHLRATNPNLICSACEARALERRYRKLLDSPIRDWRLAAGQGRMNARPWVKKPLLCKRCMKWERNPKSSAHCDRCLDYFREYDRRTWKGGISKGRPSIPRATPVSEKGTQ